MRKKLSTAIRKIIIKKEIIETVQLGNTTYRVVDQTSLIPFYKNRRSLAFKANDSANYYFHSSIYLNPKIHSQPVFGAVQNVTCLWGEHYPIKNALVLGCAGCTFPRFIALHYPESKITGVEYSEELIDIAKKYFWLDRYNKQFHLIHADAFEFVGNQQPKEKQDVIFVDIFDVNNIPPNIYSNEFLKSLFDYTNESSIIIFNLLGENPEKVFSFSENIKLPWDGKYVFAQGSHILLILTRSNDKTKLLNFKKSLEKSGNITVC